MKRKRRKHKVDLCLDTHKLAILLVTSCFSRERVTLYRCIVDVNVSREGKNWKPRAGTKAYYGDSSNIGCDRGACSLPSDFRHRESEKIHGGGFPPAAIHLTRCIFACTHALCPRRVALAEGEIRRKRKRERERERESKRAVGVCRVLVNIHTSHEARRRTLAASYKVSVNKS